MVAGLTAYIALGLAMAWAVYLLVSAYLDVRAKRKRPTMQQLERHHVNVTHPSPEPKDWHVLWPEYREGHDG